MGSPNQGKLFPFLTQGKKRHHTYTKKNAFIYIKKENHIFHRRKMLSGTSTDSQMLSTALGQEKNLKSVSVPESLFSCL